MARRWLPYNRINHAEPSNLHKLLGESEVEVMTYIWQLAPDSKVTVRDVADALQKERSVAYTTVMTVMNHLTDKGLLSRTALDKKTYLYRVALSREGFLARSSQQIVDTLVADFGDLALAQFVEAVEQVDPERLQALLKQVTPTESIQKVQKAEEQDQHTERRQD